MTSGRESETPAPLPSRDALGHARRLRCGDPRKADLLEVDLGPRTLMVKDFHAKSPWRRLLGRLQIRREIRCYRAAGPRPGLAPLAGRIDGHALAIEKVPSVLLAKADDRFSRADEYLDELRGLIDRLHARGLVHLDLRGKSNVLRRDEGGLAIVDLASALRLRPGGLAHRLFFRWLAVVDETGYLKWKARLAPDRLTRSERALLGRFALLRRLWVFNRRHRAPVAWPPRPGK